ncbi:CpsD/CapB family tyrosine-protein kinase [Mucisphaera calidilacus]|uniref:CpsD/CapB family tyrosine-protein kinase n=1 Tax=Mucisphaera calidilacus TaxID=2527982 RepID=UPI00119E12C2|nr:CpsD/CapB family tyrosine-protein kinase [Mucisphaera calidilacus]
MGYIFDALKRSGQDGAKRSEQAPPAASAPSEPVAPTPAADGPSTEASPGPFAALLSDQDLTEGLDGGSGYASDVSAEEASFGPIGVIGQEHTSGSSAFDDRMVVATNPGARAAEEYRLIRTSLLARWEQKRNLVHTVTSAMPKEGKTITSLNLGLSLAELSERSTIVIEADLRLPSFESMLNVGATAGLLACLRGESSLENAIVRVPGTSLSVITAGGRAGRQAVGLIGSEKMKMLLGQLRSRFDHVIIDTPPVLDLADAGILGGISDEVLMVARMRHTPGPLIEQAVRVLQSYHTPIGGLIATDQEAAVGSYQYAYAYRYRYTEQLREAA